VQRNAKSTGWLKVKGKTGKPKKKGTRAGGRPAGISRNLNNAHRTCLRFDVNTTGTQVSITVNNVFGALGGVVTVANTTATCICSTFKINSIKMSPAAGGEVTCFWINNPEGESKDDVVDDTLPTGITMLETLVTRPPKKSLASFWHSTIATGTNQLLLLSATQGSVIDLNISFQIISGQAAPVTFNPGTASVGAVGYSPLDGHLGKYRALGRAQFL